MPSRLQKELLRLQKNKERRLAREKGKVHLDGAADDAGSQATPALGTVKAVGTQRKCANCGQVGHIKTNKKYFNNFLDSRNPSSSLRSVEFYRISLLGLYTRNVY